MIVLLKSLAELLSRPEITVQEVAKLLGKVISGGTDNVPFKIQPSDAAIQDARVVRKNSSDVPSHVDLTPAGSLNMRELVTAFGAYRAVPHSTNPNKPSSVSFKIQKPGQEHAATLFASYEDGKEGAADGKVVALMLRRD